MSTYKETKEAVDQFLALDANKQREQESLLSSEARELVSSILCAQRGYRKTNSGRIEFSQEALESEIERLETKLIDFKGSPRGDAIELRLADMKFELSDRFEITN